MIRTIIVEDDSMVAQINKEYLLRFSDFQVDQIFSNGKDALEYLCQNPVDLAILDQYMPVLSGNELLREMRSSNIRTAVIMVTSAAETAIVEESLRYGIVDYLIKPFTFTRFQEAIQRFLAMKTLLKSTPVVSQKDVDLLLRSSADTHPAQSALGKGLNQRTLEHIQDYLREHLADKHTSKSISEAVGLSGVTVRRYLNYLIETEQIHSTIDYETGGRPRVLYHLK